MPHDGRWAMILAAGRGERMRPLTDTTPKPLLPVGDKPLIVHLIERLVDSGFRNIVVNHSHLGEQIVAALGDGRQFGARLKYSHEDGGGLETGGGIFKALPLIEGDPFLVVNGDIWTDYPFARLQTEPVELAHLVLISNPAHHPGGDFLLRGTNVEDGPGERLTFSGIGLYSRRLFDECRPGKFPLAPLLRNAMALRAVRGEHYQGSWYDVGTPARLADVDRQIRRHHA